MFKIILKNGAELQEQGDYTLEEIEKMIMESTLSQRPFRLGNSLLRGGEVVSVTQESQPLTEPRRIQQLKGKR